MGVLCDIAAERAVLAGICKYGEDAYLEIRQEDGGVTTTLALLFAEGSDKYAGLAGTVVAQFTSTTGSVYIYDPNTTNGVYASSDPYNTLSIHRLN